MNDKYILDENNNPIVCDDLGQWSMWQTEENRRVKLDRVEDYRISTVFLGLDHSFGDGGTPILFETMVFKGDSWSDLYCNRYSTWNEAIAGHNKAVNLVKEGKIEITE